MGKLAVVDGIERFAIIGSLGLAVNCSCCNASYTGGNGKDKPGPIMPRGYRGGQNELIKTDATILGWTGPMTYDSELDLCPECTAEKIIQHELKVEFKPKPATLVRWYRGVKHWGIVEVEGAAFLSTGMGDYKYLTRPINEGDYIVTVGDKVMRMTPKEVAETFQLPTST